MLRRVKEFFFDEELRAYLLIVVVSTGLITLNTLHLYSGVSQSFEMAFFQVSNIITTNWFWLWQHNQLAFVFSVYPTDADGDWWFCWIYCWWSQSDAWSYSS